MKRFILQTVGLAGLLLCVSCQTNPTISGKLEFSNGSQYKRMAYLILPERFGEVGASFFGRVIDSTEVGTNGRFVFQDLSMFQEPTLLQLAVQEKGKRYNYLQSEDPTTSNYMPIVFQEGKSLEVNASAENFQQSFSLKNPSEANAVLLKLRDIKMVAFQQYLEDKHWEVEDGSQLLEKEKAQLYYQTAIIDFANATEEVFAAMVAIRWVSPQGDYERVPEFLFSQCKKWKQKTPKNPWVQQLCEKADKSVLPTMVGDSFPNSVLPMVSGDRLAVQAQLGEKLTIIDLWASWCVPCRKENREVLLPLWEQYHDQGLQILAYGLESNEEAWKTAIEKDGAYRWLHSSHLLGDEAPFMKTLRIQTIPANFLVDRNRKVLAKNLHGKDLHEWVQRYMKLAK